MMCDASNFKGSNECQNFYPYDMTEQNFEDSNYANPFCPSPCNQCENYQETAPKGFECYDLNQTEGCMDFQASENVNYDQCCENPCCMESLDTFSSPRNNIHPTDENMDSLNYGCSFSEQEPSTDMNEDNQNFCPCPEKCRMPACSPFLRRKYIQPPRQPSFKPVICYQKPTVPISCETIYKKSFEGIDPVCCRVQLIRPKGFLKSSNCPFENDTVTKQSYQPYCQIERVRPIFPQSASLLGKGPIQGLTTQKHDFVPKFQYRRSKIVPRDTIKRLCGCVEKMTTQRLSFLAPCVDGRRPSFKPLAAYKKPELPMEHETTQKLSFLPVCPLPREELPWAKKSKYQPPTVGFAKDTITKCSYQAPGFFIDECLDQCQNQICCKKSHY